MCNESFQELFKSHQSQLYRFALRLTRSEHRAKDLLQDTALQAFNKKTNLRDRDKFPSWIKSILFNTFRASYRKTKRRKELLNERIRPSTTALMRSTCTNKGLERLKRNDIENLAKSLREETYGTFAMYVSGYSYKEIGSHMGVKVGTVKSRIHSARRSLAKQCLQHGIAS